MLANVRKALDIVSARLGYLQPFLADDYRKCDLPPEQEVRMNDMMWVTHGASHKGAPVQVTVDRRGFSSFMFNRQLFEFTRKRSRWSKHADYNEVLNETPRGLLIGIDASISETRLRVYCVPAARAFRSLEFGDPGISEYIGVKSEAVQIKKAWTGWTAQFDVNITTNKVRGLEGVLAVLLFGDESEETETFETARLDGCEVSPSRGLNPTRAPRSTATSQEREYDTWEEFLEYHSLPARLYNPQVKTLVNEFSALSANKRGGRSSLRGQDFTIGIQFKDGRVKYLFVPE